MNSFKLISLLVVCLALLSIGTTVSAYLNPVVDAGADLYISSNSSISLNGYGYDLNGYYINYYWYCNGGLLSNNNIAQPIYTPPYSNLYNQNNYTCTLTVTNSLGESNSDSITIYVNYNNSSYIQTTNATNISNFQATLNGSLSNINSANINYVYFQWGQTTSYGNQTPKQLINYPGSFMYNISNLNTNTVYHFRAVIESNNEIIYGRDTTLKTSEVGQQVNGTVSIDKKVINLNSNNRNWASSITANPLDTLVFAVTIQSNNQNLNNVTIKDILPEGLIYKNGLMINTIGHTGDITSGINIGTIYSNQPTIISYRVQVAPENSFTYGTNNLNTNTIISSNELSSQTRSSIITINKSAVLGATTIPTGITNNLFIDSFFIPLLLILFTVWAYLSGRAYIFADWLKSKSKA